MNQLSKITSTLLFIFLTGVLVVVTFISYTKVLQYNKSVEALMHINKIKSEIVEVFSSLKDAEIKQRGYLLTGDSVFLQSFEEQEYNPEFATLNTLILDFQQQENLKKLKTLVDERHALLQANIILLENDYRKSLPDSALLKGKIKMDEVKALVEQMLQTEDKILSERTLLKDRTARIAPVFLFILSLFSIGVISVFFFRLQKETNERISITESNKLLREAKQQIEASEKRFRTLSETIPHMMWTAAPDGYKNFFNKYFLDYTGFTFEELEGEGWQRIIFPDDLDRELAHWQHTLKTGEDFTIEKRVRHHSGEYRWHIARGIAQTNNEGVIIGWIGTSTEIDDQKKVTEVLAKAEEQFRTFANSIQNLAWIADGNGWLYWYNQRWYDYTGATLEEMEGWGWGKVLHPDHANKVLEISKKGWKRNEAFELTFPLRRHDGEYRWFLTRAYPLLDTDGNIERWIGTNTDITEQKAFTEELEIKVKERTKELQIQNQTFGVAEKIANMGSYKWNTTTGVMEYSDNLFRLFDCEPQEFVPSIEKFLSFIHPDDLQQVINNQEQTVLQGALVETPYRIISKEGAIKYFRSSGKFSDEGDNQLLIGSVQDISQDVAASKEIKAKNLELENANAELASFNYIASHDLQEPLRKIQAFSKRIMNEEAENLSDAGRDFFKRIDAAAQRMQNLILSLLSFSRTNTAETVFVKTDLNQILMEVEVTLQELIKKKGAMIKSQQLPTISAIPVQMHQLFLNLIGNSLKYSKHDVAPLISISAEKVHLNEIEGQVDQNGSFWKIAISDNGIGFEQQYEHKIFEMFQRLHGKTEYEGTGIGLVICKKIVLAHHGTISAVGEPGIGSTFTFLLPENSIL